MRHGGNKTVTKYKIKEENTYATDEVGIQAQGGGECEYVFGPHTKATPYQQHCGMCENITTIVSVQMAQACCLLLFSRRALTRSNGGKIIPLMHHMLF